MAGQVRSRGPLFANSFKTAAFWLGCAAVVVGVLLHLPMFLMGRSTHYRLAGMPMDPGMMIGMVLIVVGFFVAGYGLKPRRVTEATYEEIAPPENSPLTAAHWLQISLLSVAMVLDVMKTATLGFVLPGIRAEYGLTFAAVSMLPFFGLLGTIIGSFLGGALADRFGRRAAILLCAVTFMGTSTCGAMPQFHWNVAMCFLMGLGSGGMFPVGFALLAEIMPTRHRGWSLVLVGGIGSIGGYFATSMFSALLQPAFGWRILWFLGLPTALVLIVLSPMLQESARFLESMGRIEEARETFARFGVTLDQPRHAEAPFVPAAAQPLRLRKLIGVTCALTLTALAVGFVNFGVLLWLPGALMKEGHSMGAASSLIARSTLFAMPTIVLAAWLYGAWSAKRTLILSVGVTTLGLAAILLQDTGHLPFLSSPVLPVSLLMIGSSAVVSMLLPYSTESYPLRIRGRATGWVAGFYKGSGAFAQVLGLLALVPALDVAAGIVAIPAVLSMILIALLGRESQGHDLRELERLPLVPRVTEGTFEGVS